MIKHCVLANGVFGYIDPGTGGYLVSSLMAALSGFFALAAAFVVHFFRHTLVGWLRLIWTRHRLAVVIASFVLLVGTGAGSYVALKPAPLPEYDPFLSGVNVNLPGKAADGYNLFQGRLMDMRGVTIKQWSSPELGTLDKNGDYYAQSYHESPVWGRYTWDNKVIWEANYAIHHQILLTPQDTIITFTKDVHEYHGRKVEFDVILELDKQGDELQRFALFDHLKTFQKHHLKLELDQPPSILISESSRKETSVWGGNYDYYHLNSLTLVPRNSREGTHPAFKPGNWLLCFRHGSILFILDPDTKEVLWCTYYQQVEGNLEGPHCPQMLANGNILVFDNGRYREWSRVIELDPMSLKVAWEYRAPGFFTRSQGCVQKLANGNLLISETEKGRAFEITPEREIVWEYYHPERQDETLHHGDGKRGLRKEIYSMTRYPKDFLRPLSNAEH